MNDDSTILSFSTFESSELLHIVASIIENKKTDPIRSDFHHQLMITRSLIMLENNLIASPAVGNYFKIDIIIQKTFYRSEQLHLLLKQHNLTELSPSTVQSDNYKSCLMYTIITRLSPTWNKVGEYLIEGPEFLSDNGIMNAIKIDANIAGNKVYLNVQPYRIRLPKFIVEEFLMKNSFLKSTNFEEKLHGDITNVHVLPSLKQGRLTQISTRIPDRCPFENYSDIKKHWYDMYGYQLPKNDNNLYYCSISFFGRQFVYPDVCLKRCGIIVTAQQIGLNRVIKVFMENFTEKCMIGILNAFLMDNNRLTFNCTGTDIKSCCEINSEQFASQNLQEISPTVYYAHKERKLGYHQRGADRTEDNDAIGNVTTGSDVVSEIHDKIKIGKSTVTSCAHPIRNLDKTSLIVPCKGSSNLRYEDNNGRLNGKNYAAKDKTDDKNDIVNNQIITKSAPCSLMHGVHFTDIIRPKKHLANPKLTTSIFRPFNRPLLNKQDTKLTPKPIFGIVKNNSKVKNELHPNGGREDNNINYQNIFRQPRADTTNTKSDILKPIFAKSDILKPIFAKSDILKPIFAKSDILKPIFAKKFVKTDVLRDKQPEENNRSNDDDDDDKNVNVNRADDNKRQPLTETNADDNKSLQNSPAAAPVDKRMLQMSQTFNGNNNNGISFTKKDDQNNNNNNNDVVVISDKLPSSLSTPFGCWSTDLNKRNGELKPMMQASTMCEQLAAANDPPPTNGHLIQQSKKDKKTTKVVNHPNRDINEVETMVKNGNFAKINNTALIQFLRSKSIPCRVKDRKDQLIGKVKQYLQDEENTTTTVRFGN